MTSVFASTGEAAGAGAVTATTSPAGWELTPDGSDSVGLVVVVVGSRAASVVAVVSAGGAGKGASDAGVLPATEFSAETFAEAGVVATGAFFGAGAGAAFFGAIGFLFSLWKVVQINRKQEMYCMQRLTC